MKPSLSLFFLWAATAALLPSPAAQAYDPTRPPTDHAATTFEAQLQTARNHLDALEAEKTRLIARYRNKAVGDKVTKKLFGDYDNLLQVRYVDDDGKFDPAQEMSVQDVHNLVQLFKTCLRETPFSATPNPRVSAGQARKEIKTAVARVARLISNDESPSESNNSELQIVETRIRDEQAWAEHVQEVADKAGVKAELPAPRAPASDKK